MKLSIGKCWALLVFDLIGLAIAGYAYLLGFQIIQTLPQANAFIILMAFFVGIKIVILALYDLNRNVMLKNIPFIGGLITVLGNGIIFGISFFLIPEVPYYFFIGLAISDFILITLSHFLWWVIIGKEKVEKQAKEEKRQKHVKEKAKKSEKGSKDKWFSQNSEEDEYDSIFDALLQKNQHILPPQEERDTSKPPIPPRNIFEEEKKYETGEFLKDVRKNRNQALKKSRSDQELPIKWEIETESFENKESQFFANEAPTKKSDLAPKDDTFTLKDDTFTLKDDAFALKDDAFASKDDTFTLKDDTFASKDNTLDLKDTPLDFKDDSLDLKDDNDDFREKTRAIDQPQESSSTTRAESAEMPHIFEIDKEFVLDQSFADPKETREKQETREKPRVKNKIDFEISDDDDFNSIEKRLGLLFNEIENSMNETHYLQEAISVFNKEVENYKPIKGDEKIIAAGSLIREKLKAIIDKQFVVDEVLDDLIHLSKVINKRIDDLDRIEAGLNKRKASLDQKEELLMGENKDSKGQKIEILPEEVVVENLDSEYIVAGEDYEIIQRYLKK